MFEIMDVEDYMKKKREKKTNELEFVNLEPEETKEEQEAVEKEKKVIKARVIIVDNLRIRSTPSAEKNENIKFLIPKGTEVSILEVGNEEFSHVVVDRELASGVTILEEGYAMTKFLEII